jgi:hypothetical protein
MTITSVTVENTTLLPRTAAKIAAALLVLQPYPYVVGHDVQRYPHPSFYPEPETFIQPQKLLPSVTLHPSFQYNANLDVQRAPQAKVFSEPEIFPQQQRGSPTVVLVSYPTPQYLITSVRSILAENVSTFRGQRGSLVVVLSQAAAPNVPADIFNGQDTFIGWPTDSFEPPTFPQQWKASAIVLNSFTAYNPAHDVQRLPQAKFFAPDDTFPQPWKTNVTILNGSAQYIYANDFRITQQKVYSEPEVFAQAWRSNQVILNGFPPYNPATDVTRLVRSDKTYSEPEVFAQAQRGTAPVINVPQAAPYVPVTISLVGIRICGPKIFINIRPNQSYPL